MRRLNGHLLVALMVTLALVLAACSPARTPVPTQSPTPTSVAAPTPTPEPPSHTVTEAIGWLRDAGLQVEAVEGAGPGVSNPDRQVQLDGSPVRVSVDGYDRVWIYAFAPPMGREAIFRYFDMNASFTREGHPTVFNVENVTVLVRGDDTDVLEKVLVSLWDRTPIHYLTPFGIWPLAPSSGDADRARWLTWVRELAARWLQSPQRGERAVSLVADAEVRLVRLGDYLARFPASDGPYPRLPHPATLVWAVATSSEAGHAVVLLDAWNYIVVGAAYTSERLPLEEVPEVPIPGPVELTPTDGVWSEHDELAAILSWLEPAVARIIPDVWHERVETYVLERAPVRFGPWKTLAVVSRKGYNGPHAGTVYLITPPEGRAIISGRMDAATIKYWDWDVKQGVQYSYRVYGCTYLGRRTPYSDVAQAVAGDPLPDTPHPYDARPGSTPVEPPC